MSRTALVAVAAAISAAVACKVPDPPPIAAEWTDEFDRADIGRNYRPTSDAYAIVDGVLNVRGAYNHPLWLRKRLPDDVAIEFDTWAKTPDGDLKVEIFGDGESHAHDKGAYTSTGYVLCMGGWNNTKSFIARGSEHGKDMVTRTAPKVIPGTVYHWKIVRRGGRIDWYVTGGDAPGDAAPFLSFDDPAPYRGDGHGYFGFNNWQSDAYFDNLKIAPL
ncbi:MAG: hypothetical protein D6689_11150 [Deltaproteobacteria bacterium]|nr:MAG: hypothetical protein D6689_11150 [Deltaproteobacteria bacterium]